MKKILLLGMLSVFLFSCKNNNKVKNVERAFYYWKSDEYSFDEIEEEQLDSMKVNKLYVKFFEVKNDKTMGNIPIAKTRLQYEKYEYEDAKREKKDIGFYKTKIIPTVFVKNDVFLNSSKPQIDTLVSNVSFLIDKYYTERFAGFKKYNEIQIDCDWTIKSKENYFYFLKQLSQKSSKEISCTLRLYPYKYRTKMGIPPVKKATLMCYNLIQPFAEKNKNSILDTQELQSYLTVDKKYPIHLDVALPIFSWGFHYRYNEFIGFFNMEEKELLDFSIKKNSLWNEVYKDTVINNNYFRKGDVIKYESISSEMINRTITILKNRVELNETTTITLFHLDNSNTNKYSYETLTSFYTNFSK